MTRPLCTLLTALLFTVSAYADATPKLKWEYKAKEYPLLSMAILTKQLNESTDWELVNCSAVDTKLVCVFKRQKAS